MLFAFVLAATLPPARNAGAADPNSVTTSGAASGTASAMPTAMPTLMPGPVTPEEGRALIRQKTDMLLLDVRNPDEYAEQHYPGALNIPVNELEQRVSEVPAGKPVLVYCAKGLRAGRAYDIMKKRRPDVTELYYLKGAPLY
jgi:rhodanese-related sulfurtransferase